MSAAKRSPGVILHDELAESFLAMRDADVGKVVKAAMIFSRGGDPGPLSGAPGAVWPLLRPRLEQQRDRYEETCERNQARANQRWEREKKQTMPPDAAGIIRDAGTMPEDTATCQHKHKHKDINTPPVAPPRGEEKSETRIRAEWLKRTIGRFYRRKPGTIWSSAEATKLVALAKRPECLRECREIMTLYRGGYECPRQKVVTLLANWQGELDVARSWKPAARKQGRDCSTPPKVAEFGARERGM